MPILKCKFSGVFWEESLDLCVCPGADVIPSAGKLPLCV